MDRGALKAGETLLVLGAAGGVGLAAIEIGKILGARVIENLLPVLRELGLTTIFEDVNFGSAGKLFDANGHLLDEAYVRRVGKFFDELAWMAQALRAARLASGA